MPVPDLFADSTMSFGDHLEALRAHLFRCVIYLLVALVPAAYLAEDVIDVANRPVKNALREYHDPAEVTTGEEAARGFWDNLKSMWSEPLAGKVPDTADEVEPDDPADDLVVVTIDAAALREALAAADAAERADKDAVIRLPLRAEAFRETAPGLSDGLITTDVGEPFMIYLKALIVTAFVMVSPLIFAELWLFVGAGLYPHERKYVYLYMPISLGLFFAGAAFCYLAVFQLILPFLLSFNDLIGASPLLSVQPWFKFVLFLPAMFGLSFQLPLVMLALNRMGIVESSFYRENKRMAILVISFLSVILTPSDPGSMLAMMIPLVGLYFAGIWMCDHFPSPAARNPFDDEPQKKRFAE